MDQTNRMGARHLAKVVLAAWVTSVALAGAVVSTGAQAQTLRWASQGDPSTMDHHAMNEGLTNMVNGQVYEGLIARGKNLEFVPSLATEWAQTGPKIGRAHV